MNGLRNLLKAILRLFETLMGKQSLRNWEYTVRKAAESIISETESQETLIYESGKCSVSYLPGAPVTATLQLYFSNPKGGTELVEARREFPENYFLTEALRDLKEEQEVFFSIDNAHVEAG